MPFPEHFLPQQTERLILRRFIEADLDRFLAYRQDPEIARFQGWAMLSKQEAIAFIQDMRTASIGIPGEWFQIAIALQQSNLLIGDIGIQVSGNDTTMVEIGFTLHREEQGKGYAREAVQALFCLLFELVNITRVIGITDSRNHPSIRLLTFYFRPQNQGKEKVEQDDRLRGIQVGRCTVTVGGSFGRRNTGIQNPRSTEFSKR